MFAVLYRWRLKPGTEDTFREAWIAVTEAIKARSSTGGSRLHRTEDGELVAYAVWPSRERWEEASKLPPASPRAREAGAKMRECIEHSHPATPLDVIDDLLRPLP